MATRRKPKSQPRFIPDVELIYELNERTNRVREALEKAGFERELADSLTQRWSLHGAVSGDGDIAKALGWPEGAHALHWWPLFRLEQLHLAEKLRPRLWVRREAEALGRVAAGGKRSQPVGVCWLSEERKFRIGLVAFAKGPCLDGEYHRDLARATAAANDSCGLEELSERLGEAVVAGDSDEGESLWKHEWRSSDVSLFRVDHASQLWDWAEGRCGAAEPRTTRAMIRVPTPHAIAFYERRDAERVFMMLGEAVVEVGLLEGWTRDSVWDAVRDARDREGLRRKRRLGRPPYPAEWREKAILMFQIWKSKRRVARKLGASRAWVRDVVGEEPD